MMIGFFFLIETICCDHSSELFCRDDPDKGSQHIFLCRINKKTILYYKYSLLSKVLHFNNSIVQIMS